MKIRQLFWGLFFVTIGVLILLSNIGLLHANLHYFWKLWPIILILLGLSYFTTNSIIKGILASISAIVIAISLFAFFNSIFGFFNNDFVFNDDNGSSYTSRFDSSHFTESFDPTITKAELNLQIGAGTFSIQDTTNELFKANSNGHKNYYQLKRENSGDKTILNFTMQKRSFTFNGNNDNNVDIKLNSKPIWDINLSGGAAEILCDLSPYKLNNINIKMGAAKIKVKLGDKIQVTNLNLDAGASSIELLVPTNAGCEIINKAALSEKEFEDFNKTGNNIYQTANFNQARNKIFLNLNAGVSSIHVKRYDSGSL